MSLKIGVVMDPISSITIKKDTTFALLLAAQARDYPLHYMEQGDLYQRDGRTFARVQLLSVRDDPDDWFSLGKPKICAIDTMDAILMRKDPPFDMEYIYSTYLLEQAEVTGTVIVNRCDSLRDANEKLSTAWFPQCCPATLVSRDRARIKAFLAEQDDIIVKPLDGMGGASIFRLQSGDPNTNVILETLTEFDHRTIMAQRYIPEVVAGDKRILLVNGKPVPYALARIPNIGETRANLATGGRGEGVALTARDYWICEQVGSTLKERGLLFVGLDVIGDYLTEINVTSPTCVRELDALYDLDIGAQLMNSIEEKVAAGAPR